MNRRHNSKFWLLMTALGFVGGACLVGFQFSNLNTDKAGVEALRQQTQDESEVQAQLLKSQSDLDEAKTRLTHLEQGIPGTAYVPTMLQELEKVGHDSGISVTGVRPMPKAVQAPTVNQSGDGSQTVAKPAYDELNIEVKGRGTYASVEKFIKALETFPKIVGSRTVEVVPAADPKDSAKGMLDITVGLRAYLFPDSQKKDDATSVTPQAPSDANAPASSAPATPAKADAGTDKNAKPASSSTKEVGRPV